MNLLGKSIKKSVSVLLSFIMIFSLFTIIPFSVRAEDGAHTLTVDLFEPSLTNDHYENIALETKINGTSAQGASHSVQPGATVSVTARLIDNTYRFHVTLNKRKTELYITATEGLLKRIVSNSPKRIKLFIF